MRCFIVGHVEDERRTALLSTTEQVVGSEPDIIADLTALRADSRFLRAPRALVIVPETGLVALDTVTAASFAVDFSDKAFVVCLAETVAPEDIRRLARTGAADWVTWREYADDLGALVQRLSSINATQKPLAKIIGFLPSKGGVGTTTLVVETAMAMAKKKGDTRKSDTRTRVAILDLNLQGGTAADLLDIEPRFDIAEIMHKPERLDEHLIEAFASKSDGIDVFAGPFSRTPIDAVRPETVFALIDTIATRYDAVLCDLPGVSFPWSDNLLRGSDVIVVCGGDSIPALRRLSGTLRHAEGLGVSRAKLVSVVNATEVDFLGRIVRRNVIEKVLGGHRTFTVRRDANRFAEAADLGRPLQELMPYSKVSREIRRLADWVLDASAIHRSGAESQSRKE